MAILLWILTFVLILISVALVFLVLMQKTKDGGMGAALGGGATESAFGHETGNVLTNATIKAAIAFFVLSFLLYLGQIYAKKHSGSTGGTALPDISAPALPPVSAGSTPAAASATASSVNFPNATVPAATSPATPVAAEAPKPVPATPTP
jgi:preprotein translocase subunit SecG